MAGRYQPEVIAEAIRKSQGMVYIAAKRLGCSPQTIYTYARKYPEIVQRAIDEARGLMLDTAEMKLYQAIAEGESWAICFYLKCQGKHRGYVERLEQVQLTDEQLDRLIERELAEAERRAEADPAGVGGGSEPAA
ncbi:MAG: hypothetical protein GXP27_17525 [Planctomycetes bacterium]|nr:hypothetical protein [Planctomycetota bacterium]